MGTSMIAVTPPYREGAHQVDRSMFSEPAARRAVLPGGGRTWIAGLGLSQYRAS